MRSLLHQKITQIYLSDRKQKPVTKKNSDTLNHNCKSYRNVITRVKSTSRYAFYRANYEQKLAKTADSKKEALIAKKEKYLKALVSHEDKILALEDKLKNLKKPCTKGRMFLKLIAGLNNVKQLVCALLMREKSKNALKLARLRPLKEKNLKEKSETAAFSEIHVKVLVKMLGITKSPSTWNLQAVTVPLS